MKIFSVFIKIASYMPMVLLPILLYELTESFFCSGLSIVIWRIISYYNCYLLYKIMQNRIFRFVLSLIILVSLHFISIKITTIILLLFYNLFYANIKHDNMIKNQILNHMLVLSGMLVAGLGYFYPLFINVYLSLLIIAANLYSSTIIEYKPNSTLLNTYLVYFKRDKLNIVNLSIHNFCYYLFAFAIPLMGLIYYNSYASACIACMLNWLLFLPRNIFVKTLRKIFKTRTIIGLGFIITAFTLMGIFWSSNIFQFLVFLLIQGIGGGLSESFWDIELIQTSYPVSLNIWKISGIIGGIAGTLLMIIFSIKVLFLIAAFLTLAAGCINIINIDKERGARQ